MAHEGVVQLREQLDLVLDLLHQVLVDDVALADLLDGKPRGLVGLDSLDQLYLSELAPAQQGARLQVGAVEHAGAESPGLRGRVEPAPVVAWPGPRRTAAFRPFRHPRRNFCRLLRRVGRCNLVPAARRRRRHAAAHQGARAGPGSSQATEGSAVREVDPTTRCRKRLYTIHTVPLTLLPRWPTQRASPLPVRPRAVEATASRAGTGPLVCVMGSARSSPAEPPYELNYGGQTSAPPPEAGPAPPSPAETSTPERGSARKRARSVGVGPGQKYSAADEPGERRGSGDAASEAAAPRRSQSGRFAPGSKWKVAKNAVRGNSAFGAAGDLRARRTSRLNTKVRRAPSGAAAAATRHAHGSGDARAALSARSRAPHFFCAPPVRVGGPRYDDGAGLQRGEV